MLSILRIGRQRWITHIVLAVLTVIGCVITALLEPNSGTNGILTDGLGYLSLILMVFVLLIGPWQLWRDRSRRRNPVNIDLRRDTGIWAAITGLLHVAFGLTLHFRGDIVLYFSPAPELGFRDWFFFFGFSNYVGLLGTVVLIVLLFISNDLSLNKLKGPLWKLIQQSNYVLMALTFAHTFGYQIVVGRSRKLMAAVVLMVLVVMAVQAIGFSIYRARRLPQAAASVEPQS